ncbi:putative membrane protein [Bacillus phage Z3]|nr:membrane protein [Bacillus phage BC-VP]WQZ49524.1 putative membrane protein [Bacillus phage Z3]
MILLVMSLTVTLILYIIISYISYITASILHQGIMFKLLFPILKALAFIILVYISIISDTILFRSEMYQTITIKNGLLLVLVTTALMSNRERKEIQDERSRE